MTDFDYEEFIVKLYPLHRTLVSDDIDKTLDIIEEVLPDRFKNNFNIQKIPSGKKCWTWIAPKKYTVNSAYIETLDGKKIIDFDDNALHLVSYSHSIDEVMGFEELEPHLNYSIARPGAIPWKFSYYSPGWGFCLSHEKFVMLDRDEKYHVFIDSSFDDDYLKIGELCIKGKTSKELLIVTNICHPYQVNDSITGVAAVIEVLHRLSSYKFEKSLRILFLPETIGSICYFSHNMSIVPNIEYGIFTEMLGNNDTLALQYSFQGDSLIDVIAEKVLQEHSGAYRTGDFRSIVGNDELVTNGPGLNIPTISLSRSKKTLDSFPEYHTSDDNPSLLEDRALEEAFTVLEKIVLWSDQNYYPKRNFTGPVFLSGYDLWGVWEDIPYGKEMVDKIMFRLEGELSVIEISEDIGLSFQETKRIIDAFIDKKLIQKI